MNLSTASTITKTTNLKPMDCEDLMEQVRNPSVVAVTVLQYHEMSSQERGELKKKQPYFITSSARSRSDKAVKRAGLNAIVLDLDAPESDIYGVSQVLTGVGVHYFCVYTSLSHTEDKPRFRVVIPLANNAAYERWNVVVGYLNDALFLDSDNCSKTLAQAWLLPVVTVDGDYQYTIVEEGSPLDITDDTHPLVADAINFNKLKMAAEVAKPRSMREFELGDGELSPIEAYNKKFLLRETMERYGYKFTSKLRAIHPNSQSGSAGVYLFPDSERAFSHHGNDSLHGKSFDSFDLYVEFEHHGNLKEALIEAGNTIYTSEGISICEHNRNLFKNKTKYLPAVPEFDLNTFLGEDALGEMHSVESREVKYDITPPPEHCMSFNGIAKVIFLYIMKTAMYAQPTFALAAVLTILSMLSGGRLVGTQTRVRSNIMLICTGESGCGKQHHINKVGEVLGLVDPKFNKNVQNKFASGPAFWNFLADNPELLLLADECGFLFDAIKNNKGDYMAQLYDGFLQGYSASSSIMKPTVYADRERNSDKAIENPHICLMGFTTPSTLGGALTYEDSATGLLPRLALFPAVFDVPDKQNNSQEKLNPEDVESLKMIDKFTNWRGILPYTRKYPLYVPATEEAEELLNQFGKENREAMRTAESMERSLLNRAEENARRLSLLYWMDCIPPTDGAGNFTQENMIQVEHVQKAIDLVKWSTEYMSEFMTEEGGATTTSKEVNRITSIISQAKRYGEQRKGTLFDRHRDALLKGFMPHAILVSLSKKSSKHLNEILETAGAMESIGKTVHPETGKTYYFALKNVGAGEQKEHKITFPV